MTFRMLLVEDDDYARRQLTKLLTAASSGLIVDEAATVDEAFERLSHCGRPYELVLLDFKLPRSSGQQPEVDESICLHLASTLPETIVSHITSFAADPQISAHLDRVHPPSRARGFVIEKMGHDVAKRLVARTLEALHSVRIERDINRLLTMDAHAGSVRQGGSVTNRVADICVDIAESWPHLVPATRTLVESHFVVDETPLGRVSAFLRPKF